MKFYFFVYCLQIVYKIMRHGKDMSKIYERIASFHEMKRAVVARLSEGEARVSKPQAHESME